MYSSDAACDSGIKSVMHTAPLAGVDDQTA